MELGDEAPKRPTSNVRARRELPAAGPPGIAPRPRPAIRAPFPLPPDFTPRILLPGQAVSAGQGRLKFLCAMRDPERVGEVLDVMKALASMHMTQVVVTHEMSFAREAAEQVVFFDRGVILEQGPPAQVLINPREERTRAFLKRYLA